MSDILSWVVLAVGAALAFVSFSRRGESKPVPMSLLALSVGLCVVAAAAKLKGIEMVFPKVGEILPIIPFVGGVALALASGLLFLDDKEGEMPFIAGAAALASFVAFFMKGMDLALASAAAWSFLLGAAVVFAGLRFVGLGKSAPVFLASGAAVAAMVGLGIKANNIDAVSTPLALVLAGVVAAVVAGGICLARKTKEDPIGVVGGLVVLLIGVVLVAKMVAANDKLIFAAGAAILAAAAGIWAISKSENQGSRKAAMSILWLGIATVAFSQVQGIGLAGASICGILALSLAGRTDLVPTMSPILMLAGYRLFRENYADLNQAFDIGQHYGLMGVIGAVLIGMYFVNWMRGRKAETALQTVGFVLSGLLICLVIIAGGLYLGSKGATGLMAGLALLAPISFYLANCGTGALNLSLAGTTVLSLTYKGLTQYFDLERGSKQIVLIVCAVIGLVMFGVIWALERNNKNSETSNV